MITRDGLPYKRRWCKTHKLSSPTIPAACATCGHTMHIHPEFIMQVKRKKPLYLLCPIKRHSNILVVALDGKRFILAAEDGGVPITQGKLNIRTV